MSSSQSQPSVRMTPKTKSPAGAPDIVHPSNLDCASRLDHEEPVRSQGRSCPTRASKSIRDIQVFLGFVKFYWRFIRSRIAASLTSMLKTSSTESAEPRKRIAGVSGGGRNRTEPVGKHEVDRVNDSPSRSVNSDRKKFTS